MLRRAARAKRGKTTKKGATGTILAMLLLGTAWTAICIQNVQANGTDSDTTDPLVDMASLIPDSEQTNGFYEKGDHAARERAPENQTGHECGTMTLLERRESRGSSLFVVQSVSDSSFWRPTDPTGGYEGKQHILPQLYGTPNFMFHWTNGADGGNYLEAVYPMDSDADGIPDHVEDFGIIFEEVRDFLLNVRGFRAPPDDTAEPNDQNNRNPDARYDVFFYSFNAGGYAKQETSNTTSYSHLGMRNDYTHWHDPWNTDYGIMQTVAAHEFFHAIQFAYDVEENSVWQEMTSTYIEDLVYPDVNRNYWHLWAWFEKCDVNGLLSWEEPDHKYGNFIFAQRLSEDFGDDIIKEIWEEFAKPGVKGLTAIENVLQTRNTTLREEFSRFITANFFLEEMYEDGIGYRTNLENRTTFDGVWLQYEYDASFASEIAEINHYNTRSTRPDGGAWMDRRGTSYVTMKLDPTVPRYSVFFDGLYLDIDYLVKLVTEKNGVINERLFELNDQKDGRVDMEYDDFNNVTLIIANAGDINHSPPSWRVTITIPAKPPPPVYDVAITALAASSLNAFPEDIVNISLTVKNNGTVRNEDFNVSVYWGLFLIDEKQIMELAAASTEIIYITWTIPQDLNGTHRIWANATFVSDETDRYNNRLDGGILKIVQRIHDVALTNINPYRTIVSDRTTTSVNVTMANQGNMVETFDLFVYVNSTTMVTQTFNLPDGNFTFFTFVWNTTNLPLGKYTLMAKVSQVPGETDTSDNSMLSIVQLSLLGDINGDARVDMKDVSKVAAGFQTQTGDAKWTVNGDLDENGVLDMKDISTVGKHFGDHYL